MLYRGPSDLDQALRQTVRELYLKDKVVEALAESEGFGGFDVNDIYAEAQVRSLGTQWPLRPWLTLEAIEAELPTALHEISHTVIRECEDLSKVYGWDNSEATIVTILPREVEAAWMPGRWGYFVDKVPYDKVCIPHHATASPAAFVATLRHEFMHGITLNLSRGRASRWLAEALSTYAEHQFNRNAWMAFQRGMIEWREPHRVSTLVASDNRREDIQSDISAAYAQANFIARYLATHFGEAKFGELLRAMGSGSLWAGLQEGFLSDSNERSAFRKVYQMSESDVFHAAKQWVIETPLPLH